MLGGPFIIGNYTNLPQANPPPAFDHALSLLPRFSPCLRPCSLAVAHPSERHRRHMGASSGRKLKLFPALLSLRTDHLAQVHRVRKARSAPSLAGLAIGVAELHNAWRPSHGDLCGTAQQAEQRRRKASGRGSHCQYASGEGHLACGWQVLEVVTFSLALRSSGRCGLKFLRARSAVVVGRTT